MRDVMPTIAGFRRAVVSRVFVLIAVMATVASCGPLRRAAPARPDIANVDHQREVRVLSAIGMRQVVLALAPEFERRTGYKLQAGFDSGGLIADRIESGEHFDLVLVPRVVADGLVARGHAAEGSVADIAASVVGVAVRQGAPAPDISSSDAFRTSMLNARTIACPDPQLRGSSGVHIMAVFERLGIAQIVRPKLVFASTPTVAGTLPGDLVASGRAEIGVHQVQELLAVSGIRVVGPLPDELQARFVFTAALLATSRNPIGGGEFIKSLRSSDASDVIRKIGMEMIARDARRRPTSR